MRVIVIDFETFFDSKTYTLSKMGPIEYIRDQRFEVLCVGAQIDHNQTVVCPAENGLDVKFLKALKLDEHGTIIVGHNMAGFDALILSEHYGIKPWMILDTIPMMNWVGLSRIIRCSHKELTATLGHGIKKPGTVVSDGKHRKDFTDTEWAYFTDYCKDDVSQCAANFYSMLPYMKPDALKLISLTAKMATEPAFIPDIPMLQDYLAKLDAEQEQARLSLAHVLHYDTTAELLKAIRSPKIFPTLMEKVGGVCPMKWSDKKQCEIPATAKNDLDFVAMADDPNPDIALLVQTRLNLNSSIQKSRAESLVRKGAKAVPIMLATYKAHTGRYAAGSSEGSDKLNFQNLSKRDPSKLIIRQALKVPKGYKVVACDSSQVEARMLAWEAEQEDLIEQFRTGRDPYAEMASKIFHIDAQAIHDGAKHNEDPNHAKYKIYRNVGKTCVLSCLSADTEVLTDTGWKPIVMVSLTDKLWDGTQWVNHSGLSYNGMKKTINLDGLRVTENHLIWNGTTWNAAKKFVQQPKSLISAIRYATAQLPTSELSKNQIVSTQKFCSNAISAVTNIGTILRLQKKYRQAVAHIASKAILTTLRTSVSSIQTMQSALKLENLLFLRTVYKSIKQEAVKFVKTALLKFNVVAEPSLIGCSFPTSIQVKPQDVINAPRLKRTQHKTNPMSLRENWFQMMKYVVDLWDVSIPVLNVVIVRPTDSINITVQEELKSSSKTAMNFCSTLLHYQVTMIHIKHWIVSTMTVITQKVISDLSHLLSRIITSEPSMIYNRKSIDFVNKLQNCKQNSVSTRIEPVYDLLNAGPNHRFTVRTKHGVLLVHNCGYGIGAKLFSQYLLRSNVHLSDDIEEHNALSKQAHAIYRKVNFKITQFWKLCDNILDHLCKDTTMGAHFTFGHADMFTAGWDCIPLTNERAAYIHLPNGFNIWYPNLHIGEDNFGSISKLYKRWEHGKLLDNRITGPKCVENITQSLAFHMLAWLACRMADAGISIKANIHDSFCTVVPDSKVEETKATMERIMSSVPEWLAGFPVGCEAEVGTDFTVV